MPIEQIAIFTIIALAVILFIWDKWRYDLIALMALFATVACGLIPADKAFTGFSDPVVVTVACILIISSAISRSGFIDYVIKLLSRVIDKPALQITILVSMVITLSAFMNNVGALAVFLPIAISFARKAGRNPSELLMPLSFGSLLGGLITLIGTPPNLLISKIREDITGAPYKMFDFAPVGLAVCAIGIFYLSFAWRLLPKDRRGAPMAEEKFSIEDYISEVQVPQEATVVGKTISEAEAQVDGDFSIIGLIRGGSKRLVPSGRMKINADDILIIESDPITLKKIVDTCRVALVGSKETENLTFTSDEVGIVEAVVREDSQLIGLTVKQLHLRSRFNINLLATRQSGPGMRRRLDETRFAEGDVVVLQGNLDAMPEVLAELGCLPLAERSLQLGRVKHRMLPAAILGIAVLLTMFEIVPISIAFLGGVLAIGLLKILRLNEMYDAIDGPVLILLGAMIPVTTALQTTGGTEVIATAISSLASGLSGPVLIALIMLASMLITPFLNNAATVLLMAPIAANIAMKLGLAVDPFLMAVAVGTSCDFLTPIGHQSNTLVMGPGGYKFGDYWRLGMPLSLIVIAVAVPVILLVWPLHP